MLREFKDNLLLANITLIQHTDNNCFELKTTSKTLGHYSVFVVETGIVQPSNITQDDLNY